MIIYYEKVFQATGRRAIEGEYLTYEKHPSIIDDRVCSRGSDGTCQYDLSIFLTVDTSGFDGDDDAW
jgi:hypothetical protein